jgi:hypothetical protein
MEALVAVKPENIWRKRLEDCVMTAWPGCTEIIKMHIGAMDGAGLPDLYITSRGLGAVWLELKYVRADGVFDWSKEPTKLQRERIRRLYYAGARVGVVVFFEDFWVSVHQGCLVGPLGALRCDEKWDSANPLWTNQYVYNWTDAERFKALVWGSPST